MGALLAAAAASLLSSAGGCGLPAVGAAPWAPGESLVYELTVPGVPGSARASLRAEAGSDQHLLRGEAGLDAPLGLFRVRGSARSWVDAGSLRPRRYADETVDRSGRAASEARLGRGPAVRIDWTVGSRRGVNAFVRQPDVLDALSAIYFLRAAELRTGARLCFDLVSGRHAWRVSGSVAGAERVETPAGAFLAVRIDGRAARTDQPRETARLTLWVSADARRLPVKVQLETGAGAVRAQLARAPASARPP